MNGGTPAEKVDFAYKLFEQAIPVESVFSANEMIDTIAITRGRGTQGMIFFQILIYLPVIFLFCNPVLSISVTPLFSGVYLGMVMCHVYYLGAHSVICSALDHVCLRN